MAAPQLSKIKIAYVLPTLDKGGAERFLVDLILNLDQEIFAPHLFLFKRGGEWLTELSVADIPVTIFKKRLKIDPFNFWRLFYALKKFRPAIVHTELGGDFYGRLIAKILKTPVIIATEQNINPDESLLNNLIKKISNRWSDKIVAISLAVQKDIISRYRTTPDKITVIYNGINSQRFLDGSKNLSSASKQAGNSEIVFGTLGRLSPQKGQSVLINAWTKVKNSNLRCLIAGEGKLAGPLNKQIKDLGLADKIKLVGPVSNPAAYLNSLAAFVLPSLWEGLGLVILEAGLIGRPIIASAVDGITEIIDESTGYLVPAGDAEALALKLDWLAANLDNPETLAKSAKLRQKIMANFDIPKIAAQYQALYQKLLIAKKIL